MKYLIELVADPKGIEPAITAMDELNAKEKELKATTATVSTEQKKMLDAYAEKAKLGKASVDKLMDGYKQLGKAATGAFGNEAIKGATKAAESFRTQLKNSREEVIKLFVEGKATTAEIYNAARAGGALKDSIGDAQQAISVLASDTFKFDAALQGVQLGAAGFQALQAGAALFGEESEDLQKTLVKLNAIMALTQSIQQIVNLTQKQSALSLGDNILAQRTYTLVVGQSTGAMKVFKIALASTGIGLLVIALGTLIANWKEVSSWIGITGEKLDKIKDTFSGVAAGIKAFFESTGKVLKDVFKGDFSEAYNDAKLIGKNVGEAFNKGVKEAKLERALTDYADGLDFFVRVASATGQELQALQLQFESAQARLKLAKKKDDKELQDATIAFLEADKALKDYYAEKEKERQEKLKEAAEKKAKELEKEKERLDKLNQKYEEKNQKRIADNEKSFTEAEKKKQQAAMETNKILQELYEEQIAANEKNLQSTRDALDAINKGKQEQYEKEIQQQEDKEKAIKDASIQIAQQTADAIFQIMNTNRNAEFNLQIQRLNELKDKELANKDLTDAQRLRIEERYARQLSAIKTKQAQADKQAAIAQALINGALAITKILTTVAPVTPLGTPNPAYFVALATTAASTAAQVAIIAAQKIPKFAKGTEFVQGGGTETSDSVPAMLSRGERVIDAKTNKLLKGIPNKMLPQLLIPDVSSTVNGSNFDYNKMAKVFSKELANNPALMVNFDKSGFNTFIKNGVTVSQIKNNRNGV